MSGHARGYSPVVVSMVAISQNRKRYVKVNKEVECKDVLIGQNRVREIAPAQVGMFSCKHEIFG